MDRRLPDSLFRAIVQRTGAPFVIVDAEGCVVYAGDRIGTVVGWTPEQVVGRNLGEFLEPENLDVARSGMAEIDSVEQIDASVPIVVTVSDPAGHPRHVEVAALPLDDLAGDGLVALRLRSWDAQHHLAGFIRSLIGDVGVDETLTRLTRSLTASMEGCGASVHYGFDGSSFFGVVGSWPTASSLPLDGGPWIEALDGEAVIEVGAPEGTERAIGAVTGWLVPVRPRSGPAPAVLSIWRDRPETPFIGHRRALVEAVDYVELALVRSAEHERLVHLARHDALTGVGNRATFRDHLAAALALGETNIAIGFCDLDGFKAVNDRFGHGAGDDLLVEMSSRIRSTLRNGDEIARVGGDEFTVLWREIGDAEAADAAALRVVSAADLPFTLGEAHVRVGLSIGYVLAQPGATADSLLAAADAALYESKRAGGRRATRFTPPHAGGANTSRAMLSGSRKDRPEP